MICLSLRAEMGSCGLRQASRRGMPKQSTVVSLRVLGVLIESMLLRHTVVMTSLICLHWVGFPKNWKKPRRASVMDLSDAVMAISAGKQWLVRSSSAGFDAWQISNNQLLFNSSQAGSSDSATQLVFSPDGNWLVSGHKSGKVQFWKIVGSSLILSTPIEWSIHSSPIESIVVDSRSGWCFCTSSDRISCIPMDIHILMNAAKPAMK